MTAASVSVDLRTRRDGEVAPPGARAFFEDVLPAALRARPDLVDGALRTLALVPLVVRVGADEWTLTAGPGRVDAVPGRRGTDREWRLTAHQLAEVVVDRLTPMGLHASGALDLGSLTLHEVLDWWLLWRSVLDQRPVHEAGAVGFVDRDGAPLDLRRSFRITDPPADAAWFLAQAGYLHLANVFGEDEMAAISDDMDRAAPGYAPGDGRSWWARTADGQNRLVRMQGFDRHSAATAARLTDPRLAWIAGLTSDGHERNGETDNAIEALFKPIGVVQGISDVPWHKDCSLGRHAYDCCSLTVGISVTGAGAGSGPLRVLAGSHRALMWPARRQPGIDLPEVDLPTRTGDVTVHLSCTLHMAEPPVTRERRVLYTGFRLPPRDPAAVEGRRHLVNTVRELAPRTVSQPPARSPRP